MILKCFPLLKIFYNSVTRKRYFRVKARNSRRTTYKRVVGRRKRLHGRVSRDTKEERKEPDSGGEETPELRRVSRRDHFEIRRERPIFKYGKEYVPLMTFIFRPINIGTVRSCNLSRLLREIEKRSRWTKSG